MLLKRAETRVKIVLKEVFFHVHNLLLLKKIITYTNQAPIECNSYTRTNNIGKTHLYTFTEQQM